MSSCPAAEGSGAAAGFSDAVNWMALEAFAKGGWGLPENLILNPNNLSHSFSP